MPWYQSSCEKMVQSGGISKWKFYIAALRRAMSQKKPFSIAFDRQASHF
jgi:hypothetical protein